jgi:hypothetical protein
VTNAVPEPKVEMVPLPPANISAENHKAYQTFMGNVPAVIAEIKKDFPGQAPPSMEQFKQMPAQGQDGLQLWSGNALDVAKQEANKANAAGKKERRTLETSYIGMLFNGVSFDDGGSGAMWDLWRSISTEYVMGARGDVKAYFIEKPRAGGVFITHELPKIRMLMQEQPGQPRVNSIEYIRMKPAEAERKQPGVGGNKNTWPEMRYYGPYTQWGSAVKFTADPPPPPEAMFAEDVPGIRDVTKFKDES